jgi:hypothetical protein
VTINPASWDEFVSIPLSEIDLGSQIDDDQNLLLNHYFNNQEILREFQIDTQLTGSTASATYVNVATKKVWFPEWLDQPVSGDWSKFHLDVILQAYMTSGTDHDVRVRINGGNWVYQTGLTKTAWGTPDLYLFTEVSGNWDPDAVAGSAVDLEVEAQITAGGTVHVRDRGGCSFVRRVIP